MSWVAASLLLIGVALGAGFYWYERTRPPARVVALLATLAALAVIGRIAFAPLPNVKPTTDIVVITGYALGGLPGFVVGAVTAVASNLFYGQGPHTPWQMFAWGITGLIGAAAAATFGRSLGRYGLAAVCGVAGLVYGAIMNTSLWITFAGEHSFAELRGLFATAVPFDAAHVLGNVLFCLAFGPALASAVARFRTRFEVTWLAPPRDEDRGALGVAGAAVSVVALALLLPLPSASTARAAAGAGGAAALPGAARRAPTAASPARRGRRRRSCTPAGRRSGWRRRGAIRSRWSAAGAA